ncbi:PREDICTED: autophagy-related protein 18h [Tarenaya hassleriana]|uniref:autophagy-related protein 18h n=1 Tax=Tarenaya hassleriana TaxID=28532 RepID=UPI00053C1EAE|nr:PREDICTED: autophagy-related protein 18h [Tarenaya hassleriana]
MKRSDNFNSNNDKKGDNHSENSTNGLLPNSLKIISNFIRTASSGVRLASASVAASLSGQSLENKDQVLWSSFDRLHIDPSSFNHVLLLGYTNGFQVLDINDAANVSELVSKRDDPATLLQMQPLPAMCEGIEGFRTSHPLLIVVADEAKVSGNLALSPTVVRFYSLRSHNYVHVLRFRSTVYMVRCSPLIVAVGLGSQIYCFDALTLENKFSVLTYPVPQFGSQGISGINVGYGPMAIGSRWLAYASNNPLSSNTGRLSPQKLACPGVSPSTSPNSGNLVARYAMESSKHLAAGLINLGDKGYKTISKYCQDIKHDGTGSPVSSISSWKGGRPASHSAETDVAGTVVIKDFESQAIISQFRAHTSPLSALCFDPSGTLLVTASIHGNNINIFRIMPSSTKSGSGTQTYDWSSSHVHLYKLHRGMTSAVVQDICFSHYSQWVAIVSSKGTCHIFVLSPFGGENVLEIQNSHGDRPSLAPSVSLPWWSSSSFTTNPISLTPPASVNLTVISRIKSNNFFQAASSVAGIPSFPSGAIAAVFHQSVPNESLSANALEYLLVYTPSGHVVQYKIVPQLGGDPAQSYSRVGAASVSTSDEELRMKVEPVHCWDVCRRTDWPEIEENIHELILGRRETADITTDASDIEDNDIGHKELVKPPEKDHVYLANAEVQINSGRRPIWQNSKISFYSMFQREADVENSSVHHSGGETEIEKVSASEVEIRRKAFPVFDDFHSINSSNRGLPGEKYPDSSSDPDQAKENLLTGISCLAIENDERKGSNPSSGVHIQIQNQNPPNDTDYIDTPLPVEITIGNSSRARESEASSGSSNRSDLSMNAREEGTSDESPNFDPAENATEADNDAPCHREESDEGGDNDDDVFPFSEEG